MRRRLRGKMIAGCQLPVTGIVKIVNCLLLTACCLLVINCSSKKEAETANTYICPMHPTVVSDKQGVCPVCNMDLVRKARPGEEVKITEELARLIQSPNESVVANIKTIRGEYNRKPLAYEAVGVVTYDTRQEFTIPAKVGGRLEKVFLKYPFQSVKKGMKVAEIYSKELVTAQQELIYLLDQKNADDTLLDGAKSKLKLLGVSENQLNELIASRKVSYQFPVYSEYDGYIIAGAQQAPIPSAPSGMAMSVSVQPAATITELIRAGDYVSAGQTLFKVVNTRALRVELSATLEQSKSLQKGDTIELSLNGSKVMTPVDLVLPFYESNTEFATIRVNVPNANFKVGNLVSARWSKSSSEALWVPQEAIIDLGTEKVVFIKIRDAFIPKTVTIQARLNQKVAVQGLSSQDEIAGNAQFLVDSEGFVRTANK